MYKKPISTVIDKALGYEYFMDKQHPLASKTGRVYYHRHVASLRVGRWLGSTDVVHHIDGDRQNNDPGNLEVTTHHDHPRKHAAARVERRCGHCGEATVNDFFCSEICCWLGRRRVERPTSEQLAEDLKTLSVCAVGRKYGVTDNAIRKWLARYKKQSAMGQ